MSGVVVVQDEQNYFYVKPTCNLSCIELSRGFDILKLNFFLFCRNFGIYFILLVSCPALDQERRRWGLPEFGANEDLLHLTVGFAHCYTICQLREGTKTSLS